MKKQYLSSGVAQQTERISSGRVLPLAVTIYMHALCSGRPHRVEVACLREMSAMEFVFPARAMRLNLMAPISTCVNKQKAGGWGGCYAI